MQTFLGETGAAWTGLSWWQTLLVTSVPALITAVLAGMSLIIQSRTNERLERERLRDKHAERVAEEIATRERSKQEQERAALERKHSLNDHWRAERQEAHRSFSAAAYEMYEALQRSSPSSTDRFGHLAWRYQPSHDQEARFKDTFSHVQLVASLSAQRCAESVYDLARTAKFEVPLQGLEAGGIGDPATLKREWNEAIAAYRLAAREDLGTQD